jgi:hypothetical protein
VVFFIAQKRATITIKQIKSRYFIMNDNKTITLYNYVIIQQYKTKSKLIKLNYDKNILLVKRDNIGKQDATIDGILKMAEIDNDIATIDNEIEATTQTLERYNEAYNNVSKWLFGNDIVEQATSIINGGNV